MALKKEQLLALGLERNPSPAEGAPGLGAAPPFFATPALAQRLDLLHHLIQLSDLLLVVLARPGMGKSTLLRELVARRGAHWTAAQIQAEPAMGPRALLERIMLGLELEASGEADAEARLERLARHLEARAASGELAVVIIDDAELLDPAAQELVIELARRSPTLKARLVLAGRPELRAALSAFDGGSELLHPVEIQALDEGQTNDYVTSRLLAAGMQGDSPLSAQAVRGIHQRSGGVPGEIARLTRQALLEVAERRTQLARRSALAYYAGRWWKGLAVIGFALVLVALLIVLLPAGPPREGPLATPPVIIDVHPDRRAVPLARPPPGEASAEPPVPPARAPPPGEPVAPAPPPGGIGPTRTPVPGAASTERTAPREASPDAVGDSARSAPPPGAAEAPSEPAPIPAEPSIAGEAWLETQDPAHYTVQLVGTRDREALLRYLRTVTLPGPVAWVATRRGARPWYIAVTGAYPQRRQALAAIASFPPELRRAQPWPRTIGSILAAR